MEKKERYTLEYLHELFSVYYSEKKEIITSFSLLAEISPIDPEYQNVKEKVKSHIEKLRHSVSMTQEVLKNYNYVPGLGIDNSAQNEAKRFERLLDEFLVLMEHGTMTWGDEENWFDALGVRTFKKRWEKFLSAVGATYFFKSARKAARVSRINTENAKRPKEREFSKKALIRACIRKIRGSRGNGEITTEEIYRSLYAHLQDKFKRFGEIKDKSKKSDGNGKEKPEHYKWEYTFTNDKGKPDTIKFKLIQDVFSEIKKQ